MLWSPTQESNSETARRDAWLNPRQFAAMLVVFGLASYPQVFLGLQTFVYRDFGYFSYPIAYYFRESFWRGEIPLWNPLNYCGVPFLAQWNTQVLYPPALFYLLLPLSHSLGVFCLLHLLLGGLGMYFLADGWTQNRFAAAFAGVVFAFNGLMLNSLTLPATIASLGWMPWVVWLTEKAWRQGGRTLIVAVAAGALQMLSGGVEMILLTWGLLGALGLAELVRGKGPRGKMLWRAGLIVLLITGLCAAQLLPFFDLLSHSHRQETFRAGQWPMPATGWLNFLVPLFNCRSYQGGVFMQNNQNWTASYYVGVTTLALAALAVWRRRGGRAWLLAALTLFCLILALGDATPVFRWLRQHSSILGLMRYPVKFVILPVFALPLLAAYGLNEKQPVAEHNPIPSNRRWHLIWPATGLLMLGIIGWAFRFRRPNDDYAVVVFNGAVRAILFFLIVGGLFWLEKISERKLSRRLQILLLLLVWFDLYCHAPRPSTVNRAIFEPNPSRFSPSTPSFGTARAMIPPSANGEFLRSYLPDLTDDYVSRRFALLANCNLLDNIPMCDGFLPLFPRACQSLFFLDPAGPLLDFLGVSQMITIQGNSFNWEPRSTFMPLLTGGQKPVFADEKTSLPMVVSTNFNPRQEVYLPLEAKAFVTATNASAVKILLARFHAQHIEAEIEAGAPAVLVAAQMYYHSWQASVDGKPVPLWRANYAFQALAVPAGRHSVTLRYEDRAFFIGVMISLATLAGCLVFFHLQPRFNRA
jgi:hypothetical protein